MKAIGFPVVKNGDALEVGELIVFRVRNDANIVAICVSQFGGGSGLWELHGRGESIPGSINADRRCASYGSDWVIETTFDPDRAPLHVRDAIDSGFVFAATDGPVIKLTDAFDGTVTFYGLKSMETLRRPPDYLVPISSFRIWASERDMNTPGATPVYASQAPEPPGVDVGAMIA